MDKANSQLEWLYKSFKLHADKKIMKEECYADYENKNYSGETDFLVSHNRTYRKDFFLQANQGNIIIWIFDVNSDQLEILYKTTCWRS